jgi:hypothetical protein
MYDISMADVLPIVDDFSSHGYSQNEWTQILKPDKDIEYGLVGLSGRAIIFDGDNNNGRSGADVPFTHPFVSTSGLQKFGSDWEFYIAPDAAYQKLAAAPAPSPDKHCEYAESVSEAHRDFQLDVVNTLGVEIDEMLLPAPYRPHHGDRVAVWGRWIVDTGHPDFHTEIHPPLLLATGRATSSDETTTTVIGRPYLVGQRWNDCGPVTCTSHGLMDHILDEAGKVPGEQLTMVANPNIIPKAWYGSFLVNYTVRPPTPRVHPSDRLMVRFHFTVWTGVVVQLSNVGDAVSVTIKMREGNLNKDVTLPPAQQYFVTVEELKQLNQAEAGQLDKLNGFEQGRVDILTVGIGKDILARGIKTTKYLGPNAPPTSFHTTQVPVTSLNNSPYYAVDDKQPWPIFGTMTLTWERGP